MKKHINILILNIIVLLLVCTAAYSQNIKTASEEAIRQLGSNNVEDILKETLNNPELLNKVLQSQLSSESKFRYLKDLNLEFKTFFSNDVDSIKGLGVSYSYSKSLNFFKDEKIRSSNILGYSLSFSSRGNIAFNSKINPVDFLKTNLAFHFFNSNGGVISDTVKFNYDKKTELKRLRTELADKDDPWKSQAWKKYLSFVQNNLSNQYYVDLSILGSFESNQKFTQKNYNYGLQLGIDIKAWNDNDFLAMANVFDWPFALIRYLTETDEMLTPKGSTIPTVLLSLERVEPVGEDPRIGLGEREKYDRFGAEIAFKTVVFSRTDLKAYFEAAFRYYRYLKPDDIIKINNLEESRYFVCAFKLSNGMFVSYSDGELPFDRRKDKVYSLGYDFHF